MTGHDKLMTGFAKVCHAVSLINPRTCKQHDEHDTISRVRLLRARAHERLSGKSPSCASCDAEVIDFKRKNHDGLRTKPGMSPSCPRPTPVSGRPGSSTRLRASQGPGPGDDDGAEDLGELDPNAPSTVSLYDAPLNPYRGGLLDLPETDEAAPLARGYAGPERRRDATAAVTLQPPLHRGRNRRFRRAFQTPPRTVGEISWRAGSDFRRKRP